MHATSLLTLVLGATAVSAAALNAKRACDPYCNFPANGLDCPQNGGVQLSRDEVISAARGADRSGPPRENSASNLATSHCSSEAYNGVPLWTVSIFSPFSKHKTKWYHFKTSIA